MESKRNSKEPSAAPAEPGEQPRSLDVWRHQSRTPSPGPFTEGHNTGKQKSRKRDKFFSVFRFKSSSQNKSANLNPDINIIAEPTEQPGHELACEIEANSPAKQDDSQDNNPTRKDEVQKQGTLGSKCNEWGVSKDLWGKAFESLPTEQKCLLQEAGMKVETISGKREFLEELLKTAREAQARCKEKRWKLKWGQWEIDVREKAEAITGWIERFKHIGDVAIQYDPVHTALPWAGVRFILTILISGEQNMAAAVVGVERITMLVSRCTIYEQLYLTSEVVPTAEMATENLSRALLDLYTAILVFLSLLMNLFTSNFGKRTLEDLKHPGEVLEYLNSLDKPELAVDIAADAVEKCYHGDVRIVNQKEFNALKELLKHFEPIIRRIDSTTTAMYKSIEESERKKILRWFSEVPYQSHHDLAQEGRIYGTGKWLFNRAEFRDWWQAESSEILWLHGIPGAGKTKLMSAAIDYLQAKADKVAFFYCKRDEQDRRCKDKILLSLIKQLACPDSSSICKPAIEAYEKQEKDPSARKHLPTTMSIELIVNLLKCYGRPVIMLDALDECPEDVRRLILKALSSIVNSNCPLKVLVSSRLTLDIQDSLKEVPYVCIEAQDNAEDIKHYVETELERRIESKELLRGQVSAALREQIQQVLLRHAHGMFLWVEYQLRDLCKFRLEMDIRNRLGKLPKGLTGVYDEIMATIKSQEGSGSIFAERVLKWMLVSCRPLTPREIVAVAILDSSIPLSTDKSETESTVEVEVVLSFCGGLLVWDRGLDVIRFAHLSVNEYLETKSHRWDTTDAQLHVAEDCLWTLQNPRNLELSNEEIEKLNPLYPYAAMHWFRHCRSFQDLVLSSRTKSITGSQHALEIPLLDSFLSSFGKATTKYIRWTGWVPSRSTYYRRDWHDIWWAVKSEPMQPAFAAALGGLGELVSWLWQSENADMNVRTLNERPLLDVAIAEGQNKWIVEFIVQHGGDVNYVYSGGTSMTAAAETDSLEIVSILLERGADINVVSGGCRTALNIAARNVIMGLL